MISCTAEFFSRNRSQFPADHIFFCFFIPGNRHIFNCRLRAFHHSDFKIDGIIVNGSFNRINPEEQITIIQVKITDAATFLGNLFPKFFIEDIQIIYISFMDTQYQR